MKDAHRQRLREAGARAEAVDAQTWTPLVEGVPQWWHDCDNALYLADGAYLPTRVLDQLMMFPMRDVVIAVGSPMEHLTSLLVGGDRATVFVGERVVLTAGEIYCGAESQVVLHGPVVATRQPVIDARNGGSIVVEGDQLWAADVYVATDDMHRLTDVATGDRINPFGAHVRIGRHVWLCREAVVTGHVEIGEDACVGMRSLVRGQKVPAGTVVAGVPARVVREGTTWSFEDTP